MAYDDEADLDDEESPSGANGAGDGAGSQVLAALKSKELLIPAAVSALGAVAASAGPGLIRRLGEATEDKGADQARELGRNALEGAKSSLGTGGNVAGRVVQKAFGGGGAKKTRRLPIERWTDVAVPVEKAYEAWLKFDQYPKFMHRVVNVERKDGNDTVQWEEKIWFSKRQWKGRITDRRKNDRIAWTTTSGMSHKGVVSFHPLADNLTRVMVTMEFEPNGMLEKMASGLRFVKRAVQADLARYKAFVEMDDAKGIEYRPVKDDEDEKSDARRSSRRASGKDDATRESERRERESRREERRRETVGSG